MNIFDAINTGSQTNDEDLLLSASGANTTNNNVKTGHPPNANGQYASFPGMTPKYMRHIPGRNREKYDTAARMMIRVRDSKQARRIVESLRDSVSKDVAAILLGDGKTATRGYVDFFLDTIQTAHAEKVQVTEVLEDNYVAFFFGSQPPTYTFSGHLMNTIQDDWAVQMLAAYQDLFRGTQLARRGLLLYIRYDSYMVAGAVTSLMMNRSAANETAIPFSLQMLVHKIHRMYDTAYGATVLPYSGAGSFDPSDANPFVEVRPAALKPYLSPPGKDAVNANNPAEPADINSGSSDQKVEDAKVREEIENPDSTAFDEARSTGGPSTRTQTITEINAA
jgi:hypothetical protein